MCDDLLQCLKQLHLNPTLAVAIPREFGRSIREHLNFPFHCFRRPEIIHSFALKFRLHEDFLYKNELNEFLIVATETGLIEKWRSDTRTRFDRRYAVEEVENGLMTLDNLSGILILWALLNVIVALLFLLEIIVYRQVKRHNARRFWKAIEIIIDPDRHFMLETKWT